MRQSAFDRWVTTEPSWRTADDHEDPYECEVCGRTFTSYPHSAPDGGDVCEGCCQVCKDGAP